MTLFNKFHRKHEELFCAKLVTARVVLIQMSNLLVPYSSPSNRLLCPSFSHLWLLLVQSLNNLWNASRTSLLTLIQHTSLARWWEEHSKSNGRVYLNAHCPLVHLTICPSVLFSFVHLSCVVRQKVVASNPRINNKFSLNVFRPFWPSVHKSNCSFLSCPIVQWFICPVVHPSFCHFVNLSFLPSCLFGCLSSPFVTCLPNEKVLRSQAINMYFFKHSQNVLHKAKLGCK